MQIAMDATRSGRHRLRRLDRLPDRDVPIQANKPGDDGFVAKLNPTGTALAYSTYLGGNEADRRSGIAVDSVGNAYVDGATDSIDFNSSARQAVTGR